MFSIRPDAKSLLKITIKVEFQTKVQRDPFKSNKGNLSLFGLTDLRINMSVGRYNVNT